MTDISLDQRHMTRAFELAANGRFTTTPNPNVGCVIAHGSEVVGEGWHHRAGTPHAERHALEMAKDKSVGATAYVTLEPCSHWGRTGPCADALIEAQISRVVVAMADPNPKVKGIGIQRLRDAGIQVDVGLMSEQGEAINRGFLKRMRQKKPFVTVKLAASLDGKIALSNGQSKWITGAEARSDVQYHRAQVCAILSSAKTVIMDNASLVVRQNELPEGCSIQRGSEEIRQPLRVIIDIHNELQGNERLFSGLSPIVVVSHGAREQALPGHVTVLTLDSSAQRVDIRNLLSMLAKQYEINHLWVEAGATLAGAMLDAGCVDELILYQAPMLLGDKSQDMLRLPEWQQLSDAIQLTLTSAKTVGNDTKMNFSLTYQPS